VEARGEAERVGAPFKRYLRYTPDTAVKAVVLEDSAALIGLVLAAGGLLGGQLTGSGVWDGIATDKDLLDFFSKLPNPDKQFTVMPGIAHTSLRSKNWRMVYELIDSCCSRAGPVYTGKARG